MRCGTARDRLTRPPLTAQPGPADAIVDPELTRHLDGCPACSAYAARLAAMRRALASHHAGVEPGPEFAARVVERLPGAPELLGWASLRLLPLALALVVFCSWYSLTRGPGLSDLLLHPDDHLLATIALTTPAPEPPR